MECKSASAADLPEEVWMEIFKNIDGCTLLKLSLVCKHWNWLIFKCTPQRFQLNLDPEKEQMPQKVLKLAPDRNYRHLHLRSPTLHSSSKLMNVFKKLAPNVESLKLSLESLDFGVLMEMLTLCPRLNQLCLKGFHSERVEMMEILKRVLCPIDTSLDKENKLRVFDHASQPCVLNGVDIDTTEDSRPTFPTVVSLGLDITANANCERALLACFPNVTELETVARQPNLNVVECMASRLKVLKVKVLQDAAENFFQLQLPALEVLVLKLSAPFEANHLKQFLLGCSTLKTAMLDFPDNADIVPTVAEGLPLVKRLQISGETMTNLHGLVKMTNLKELALKGCYVKPTYVFGANSHASETVEKLECIGAMIQGFVGHVVYRFPHLKNFTLWVHRNHDMEGIGEWLQNLEEFTLIIDHVYPNLVKEMRKMVHLKKLVIQAKLFAKTNFQLLQKVMTITSLKNLTVDIAKTSIPMEVARQIASENRACMFLLNGERVEPGEIVQRAGKKRKVSSTAVASTSAAE